MNEHAASVMGLVLAAGCSERMGRPKQLLQLGDRPLLQHAIDAAVAARTLSTVTIVLGHAADEIQAALALPARDVHVVVNPRYRDGQSTSLRAGLAAAPADVTAAAVLLGDQPLLGPARIDEIVSAFLAGHTPIARPTYDDGAPGHPVVLARRVWPTVDALRGDQGARAVMAAHPEWLTSIRLRGDTPTDIDTPADYERVRRDAPAQ